MSAPKQANYDVIIIGAGLGGAAAFHHLALAGKKILIIEKGNNHLDPETSPIIGKHPELSSNDGASLLQKMVRAGRWIDPVFDVSGRKPLNLRPFMGSGTGGSSALYGSALERIWRVDFEPRKKHTIKNHNNLPDHWPISYDELVPYYEQAEKLMQVRGEADPLNPDTYKVNPETFELSEAAKFIREYIQTQGLTPFRTHLGIAKPKECLHCVGFICPKSCKRDGFSTFIQPHLHKANIELLSNTKVTRLIADKYRVKSVQFTNSTGFYDISADTIILSAGGLGSPALLLKSKNETWPNGLGNNNGLVGKNLMRHCIDFFFLQLPKDKPVKKCLSDFAISDFYNKPTEAPWGSIKSTAQMIPFDLVKFEIRQLAKEKVGPLSFLYNSLFEPIVEWALKDRFEANYIWTTILEDLPYLNNRMELNEQGEIQIYYKLFLYEKQRIDSSRKYLKKLFKPFKPFILKQANDTKLLSHVCGTCRFGDNPNNSVLDRNNKIHGLENIYVLDASFFPSSTGSNPSLTIAANALRVGDIIAKKI